MAELQRLTTEYVEEEDRIRLAGEASGAQEGPVVMWLTQRLLQRLLPVLLKALEGQGAATPHADLLHSFAQQAARAELAPAPPVQAGESSTAWLVRSVDITQSAGAVRLTFKGNPDQQVSVTLAAQPLRQWLGILHDAYRKAGWPLQVWPQWVQDGMAPVERAGVVLH